MNGWKGHQVRTPEGTGKESGWAPKPLRSRVQKQHRGSCGQRSARMHEPAKYVQSASSGLPQPTRDSEVTVVKKKKKKISRLLILHMHTHMRGMEGLLQQNPGKIT